MSEFTKDEHIAMLTIAYMQWAYPKASNATGDASVVGFLSLYRDCEKEIRNLYPTFVGNFDLEE